MNNIANSVKELLGGSFISKGFRFLGGIVLARILLPEDYGYLVIANIITQFIMLFSQFGIQAFYIQDNEFDKVKLFSSTFFVDLIMNIIIIILLNVLAFYTETFYDSNIIGNIIRLSTINIFLLVLIRTHLAYLKKNFKFKVFVSNNIISDIISVIFKIIFAILGYGALSFVIGEIIGNIGKVFFTIRKVRIIPHYRKVTLEIIKKILWFGKHTLVTSISLYLSKNVDKFILSRTFSVGTLGSYNFGLLQSRLAFDYLMKPLNNLLFSLIPKIKNDTEKLRDVFEKIVYWASVVILPLYLFLIIGADIFITVLFGEKWLSAQIFFQIFCINMIVEALTFGAMPMLISAGYPNISSKFKLFRGILIIINVGICYLFQAPVYMYAIVYSISVILGDTSQFFYTVKKFKLSLKEAFLPLKLPLLFLIIVMLGYVLLRQFLVDNSFINLLILGFLFFGSFIFLILIFDRNQFIKNIKQMSPKNKYFKKI